jgi:hydroxymethylpyrimidine kinase/phosphomethylpyrimidine kinase
MMSGKLGRIPCALTIAGSDSGGGAGIQADLKTFAALGVHGMSAITSITAQNTVAVTAVQDVTPEMVRAQIRAVAEDMGVDAAKTGMLHVSEIIGVVSEEMEGLGAPLVVDPVMIAKSGAALLEPDAKEALIKKLLPLATVVTPNAMEAEAISGFEVVSLDGGRRAAERIAELGPEAVLVKGGHILNQGNMAVDILYHGGEFTMLTAPRHETRDTHGTGCSLSSAIAAELAKGNSIHEGARTAKGFVNRAIKYGLRLGRGHGPLNPMANLYNEAEKYSVISNIRDAVDLLEATPEMRDLVPEVQMNVGMALPYAVGYDDIAAVVGRIVRTRRGVKASGCPEFGASRHIANTILAVKESDPDKRAAMNLKYSEKAVRACEEMGMAASFYDRREEPEDVKEREGSSTAWGARQAVERAGGVPDLIYHHGDVGKEPMIVLIGETALEVAEKAVRLAKRLS